MPPFSFGTNQFDYKNNLNSDAIDGMSFAGVDGSLSAISTESSASAPFAFSFSSPVTGAYPKKSQSRYDKEKEDENKRLRREADAKFFSLQHLAMATRAGAPSVSTVLNIGNDEVYKNLPIDSVKHILSFYDFDIIAFLPSVSIARSYYAASVISKTAIDMLYCRDQNGSPSLLYSCISVGSLQTFRAESRGNIHVADLTELQEYKRLIRYGLPFAQVEYLLIKANNLFCKVEGEPLGEWSIWGMLARAGNSCLESFCVVYALDEVARGSVVQPMKRVDLYFNTFYVLEALLLFAPIDIGQHTTVPFSRSLRTLHLLHHNPPADAICVLYSFPKLTRLSISNGKPLLTGDKISVCVSEVEVGVAYRNRALKLQELVLQDYFSNILLTRIVPSFCPDLKKLSIVIGNDGMNQEGIAWQELARLPSLCFADTLRELVIRVPNACEEIMVFASKFPKLEHFAVRIDNNEDRISKSMLSRLATFTSLTSLELHHLDYRVADDVETFYHVGKQLRHLRSLALCSCSFSKYLFAALSKDEHPPLEKLVISAFLLSIFAPRGDPLAPFQQSSELLSNIREVELVDTLSTFPFATAVRTFLRHGSSRKRVVIRSCALTRKAIYDIIDLPYSFDILVEYCYIVSGGTFFVSVYANIPSACSLEQLRSILNSSSNRSDIL